MVYTHTIRQGTNDQNSGENTHIQSLNNERIQPLLISALSRAKYVSAYPWFSVNWRTSDIFSPTVKPSSRCCRRVRAPPFHPADASSGGSIDFSKASVSQLIDPCILLMATAFVTFSSRTLLASDFTFLSLDAEPAVDVTRDVVESPSTENLHLLCLDIVDLASSGKARTGGVAGVVGWPGAGG